MNANQLAALVLRLLGIYCLVEFIPFVSVFGSAIFHAGSTHDNSGIAAMIIAILSLVFWLGAGILLIAFSVPWGKRLTKDFAESNVTALPFEQVQVLAFAVAGTLIFAETLPQLFSRIYSLTQLAGRDQHGGMKAEIWLTLLPAVGTFLKAGLGLWMFFGARGFANSWRWLRNFGTPNPPKN